MDVEGNRAGLYVSSSSYEGIQMDLIIVKSLVNDINRCYTIVHVNMCTYTHCVHTYIHTMQTTTQTQTHIHTYTYTHIHIHTHTNADCTAVII